MAQGIGLAVLAGVVSSALYLALALGTPGIVLFVYFVQLPLLFVGLTMGWPASLIAVGSGLAVTGTIAGAVGAMIYAVIEGLPSLLLVRQALLSRAQPDGSLEWYPLGRLLVQITLLACVLVLVAYAAMSGGEDGVQATIERFMQAALAEFGGEEFAAAEGMLRRWTFMLPTAVAVSWLVMIVVNGALAQALAVRLGWNRRPSPDFASLELPSWLWLPLGAAVLMALLGGGDVQFVSGSLLIVLLVPFVVLGFAVVHALSRRWPHRRLGLAAIYAAVVVLGWPLLFMLALGLVEDRAQLRRRMT